MLTADHGEVNDDHQSEYDSVPSEYFKIMRSNVAHEKTDDQDRDDKSDQHADCQDRHLHARKIQVVLDELEKTCTEHDRDCQNESKLGSHCPGNSDHDPAQDSRA